MELNLRTKIKYALFIFLALTTQNQIFVHQLQFLFFLTHQFLQMFCQGNPWVLDSLLYLLNGKEGQLIIINFENFWDLIAKNGYSCMVNMITSFALMFITKQIYVYILGLIDQG